MAHVDPAHLMELALRDGGVPPDDAALPHLTGCARCREELGGITRVVAAARAVEERDLPAAPPERVWRAVARDIAVPSYRRPPRGLRGAVAAVRRWMPGRRPRTAR